MAMNHATVALSLIITIAIIAVAMAPHVLGLN